MALRSTRCHCNAQEDNLVLIFPQDLGDNASSGPTVAMKPSVALVAGADPRRPVGLLSSLPSLRKRVLVRGVAVICEGLHHDGPLPPTCTSLTHHTLMNGLSDQQGFSSSPLLLLGASFW